MKIILGVTGSIAAYKAVELLRRLRAEGADVWGISPDDADSHAAFRAAHDLPFALLFDAGAVILGTYARDIDKAEDRHKFSALLEVLRIEQPAL